MYIGSRVRDLTVFGVACLLVAHGCSGDIQTATNASGASTGATSGSSAGAGGSGGLGGSGGVAGSGGTGGAGGGPSGAMSSGSSGAGGCHPFLACPGHIYECGDGLDNDADGLIDSDDPECLGPCDNAEDGFYVGIPGQPGPSCVVDCYFDQDTGSGNDDCRWNHKCDPNEVPPNYYPEAYYGVKCAYNPATSTPGTVLTCADLHAAQSVTCHDVCGPLVPNGCDCFGCCELPAGGGKYVWLGSLDGNGIGNCTLADAADPTKCNPCLPVAGCLNPCDACEKCIGKNTVPGGCSAQDQCAPGLSPCGLPGQGCCPGGTYCITGCCQPLPM